MGIACALGALLALHLTASGRERAVVKVLAAAALAPIAVTLYLTFSRGAIWVLPIGFVLYVLLAQPRGLLTALPAALVPAAIAAKVAYGAELLARADYDTSAAAASQGRHVALVVLVCALAAAALRAAAIPLDKRLEAIRIDPDQLRFLRLGLAGGLVIALLLGALVADAPRRISDARATFSEGQYMDYSSDLRTRLDLGGGQRADRQLARRARRRRGAPAEGHGRRHLPDHVGPRASGPADQGQRRPLAVPGDADGARDRRARCSSSWRSARCWRAG